MIKIRRKHVAIIDY